MDKIVDLEVGDERGKIWKNEWRMGIVREGGIMV